jgi:hypothetical protein
MLAAPLAWYGVTPGVPETGPFNPHFVRDIGCAYLVVGASLLWLLRDARAWPAALASGAFLSLHAGVHAFDFIQGRIDLHHAGGDAVLVVLPAVLLVRMALRRRTRIISLQGVTS